MIERLEEQVFVREFLKIKKERNAVDVLCLVRFVTRGGVAEGGEGMSVGHRSGILSFFFLARKDKEMEAKYMFFSGRYTNHVVFFFCLGVKIQFLMA